MVRAVAALLAVGVAALLLVYGTYVFIFFGALRPHSRVSSAGLFWVWGVFMVSYGTRALRWPVPFAVPVAMLVLAMLVRLSGLVRNPGRASHA